MIIDCHGHYTTAPEAHSSWREAQRAAFEAGQAPPPYPRISDDEIRESIEGSQLRLMRERGIDVTVFSPRASAMGHHVGDEAVSSRWTRVCNDLIARVVELYPDHFIGVCQLPQSPGVPIARSVVERRRCVEELGFVGCNLNPDPSGGHWTSAPLTDRSWYPLYEAMVELDVPAMVHVSAVTNPNFHATGSQVMLEAQQRGIEANPGYDFYNLNIDAGSMWTRRIVADMIAAEAGVNLAAGAGAAAALSGISTAENTGNGHSAGTGMEAEVSDGVARHRDRPEAGLMARGL